MHSTIKFITTQTNLSEQEAWWLLEKVTGKSKASLVVASSLLPSEQAELSILICQLSDQKMPLAYILGFVPFLDLRIDVKTPILIPRPETEEWVDQLIFRLKNHGDSISTILDLGTGSGCIALALAKAFPCATVTAIDTNDAAIVLAAHNAKINNISNIVFTNSDLFENLQPNARFDLIVSNPPYINPEARTTLARQVTSWEDPAALFAQNQGLAIIERILKNSASFLNLSSDLPFQLIIEIDQYHKDAAIACALLYSWNIQAQKDLFSNWRTLWCSKII